MIVCGRCSAPAAHRAKPSWTLGLVALEEKRYSDGEALARGTMAIFDKDNVADNGAWARAVLARNLLAEGKFAEAQTFAGQAVVLSQKSTSQMQRFEATLADSRVKIQSGKTSEANRQLETMLATTRKFGYRSFEFQARLALAEIELQSHPAAARVHLIALAKEAQNIHLLLVAKHAQELQSK